MDIRLQSSMWLFQVVVAAASEIMRSMRSSLNYQQSKQVAECNSTIEREALSENDKEEAKRALAYQASKYEAATVAIDTYASYANIGAHLAEDLVLTYLHRYRAFFYCLATISIAYIFMVSSLRANRFSHVRWWFYTLGMFCIMGAYGAVCSCWNLAISALCALHPGTLKAVRFMVAFLCLYSMALVTCHGYGFCLWLLQRCMGVAPIGLTAAFAIWSSRCVMSSIAFSASVVATLLYYGLEFLAFLCKTVENRDHSILKPLQLYSELDTAIDADQLLLTSRMNLLLLGILAASLTYPIILHTTYPGIYQAFFYCSATAFVSSVVILILLLSNKCRTRRIKYYALQDALTSQGNCSGSFGLVYSAANYSESADPAVDDEDDANRPTKRSPREATWRVACAAPHHMTGNRSLLLTDGYMPVLDSNDGEVRGSGSVRTESIALDDVWYVPGLDSNLVSTGQLARQGCAVNLGPGGCRITRDGSALVGTARFTEECQFELDFLKVDAAPSM